MIYAPNSTSVGHTSYRPVQQIAYLKSKESTRLPFFMQKILIVMTFFLNWQNVFCIHVYRIEEIFSESLVCLSCHYFFAMGSFWKRSFIFINYFFCAIKSLISLKFSFQITKIHLVFLNGLWLQLQGHFYASTLWIFESILLKSCGWAGHFIYYFRVILL